MNRTFLEEEYFSNSVKYNNRVFDPSTIRRDFPILKTIVHNKPLVYFDNATTTHKPGCVIQTEKDFYERMNSNIHRAVHFLSEQATLKYESARDSVRKFINAKKSSEIIFVRGTTEAINLVAYSYGKKYISDSDEIIVTAMEHHANFVPWQVLCEEKKAKLRVVPMTPEGELNIGELDNLINEKTRIIALVHVSSALGTINPVKEIIRKAHRMGIPVLLDGSQAVSHMKVDVQDIDCDFYAFSGHKMYGPTGIGVLYGKEEYLDAMPPYQTGGSMIDRVTAEKTTYNIVPYKFEAGTPNICGAIALQSAIEYLENIDLQKASLHELMMMEKTQSCLKECDKIKVIGNSKLKGPIISFTVKDMNSPDIGRYLDSEGIAIRAGHHCTQPTMDYFRIPATARLSFGIYNTLQETDILINALRKLLGHQGSGN